METREYNIIVAEDNPADVALVRQALAAHGVNCAMRVIPDGEQMVALIAEMDRTHRTHPVDLLILDMHLPRQDGEEILRTLRASDNLAQLPVVVMTASSSPAVQSAAVKHAALVYFRKPTDLDEFMALGAIVREVLESRDAAAAAPAAGASPGKETP